jgi:ribose transport system substrate-binding protein
MKLPRSLPLGPALAVVALAGCNGGGGGGAGGQAGGGAGEQVGKFLVLGTQTDGADQSAAKKNAENTLLKFPDVDALVGLWAYNTPQCLEAVRDAGKLGSVKLFGFDEDEATLRGIAEGHVEGTIVQQPYQFGYQSMRYLTMIARGEPFDVPESGVIDIPARTITAADVQGYSDELAQLRAMGAEAEAAAPRAADQRFAFVTNNASTFWSYARAGCYKAEQDFGIAVDFETPSDGSSSEQNRILENILKRGGCSGVAVTPLDPANQTALLNRLAAAVPLICHDSDAPESDRRFYLGTNNYEAGRLLGKLIKERMPEGGSIMVFVGQIDVMNASERRRGMLEELRAEG